MPSRYQAGLAYSFYNGWRPTREREGRTGIEREMSWEFLNLFVHTGTNGHTTPSRTRSYPSVNTDIGTGVNGHASPPIILPQFPRISTLVFNVTP
jgi:hypothetical protein